MNQALIELERLIGWFSLAPYSIQGDIWELKNDSEDEPIDVPIFYGDTPEMVVYYALNSIKNGLEILCPNCDKTTKPARIEIGIRKSGFCLHCLTAWEIIYK